MKFKTCFHDWVDLTPETYTKRALLGFNLWHASDGDWHFTKADGDVEFADERKPDGRIMGYATAEEAAIAGIKYYTAGNKP